MYKTKELNKNIAKSYLTIGDPYRDPHVIEGAFEWSCNRVVLTVRALVSSLRLHPAHD